MEWRPQSRHSCPLGERFQVVHRLSRFHFNDALHSAAAVHRHEHEIGVRRQDTRSNRRVLFLTWIDSDFEAPAEAALQQADDAVVLELFPDGPY